MIEGKPIPVKTERNEQDEVVELLGRLLARAWLQERRMTSSKVLPVLEAAVDAERRSQSDGDRIA